MITLIKLGKNGLIFNSSCLIGDLMIPGLMTWTYSMDFNIFSFKKLSDGIIFILKYFFCVKGQKKQIGTTLPSWAALEGEATAQ